MGVLLPGDESERVGRITQYTIDCLPEGHRFLRGGRASLVEKFTELIRGFMARRESIRRSARRGRKR